MPEVSFKQRVASTATTYAGRYKAVFVDYEYLLCSEAFTKQDYYIIAARPDNYRHLLGVNTTISANDFFEKCISGTLTEFDFDFCKRGYSENEVKGSVREKILAMPDFISMFDFQLFAQENFVRNRVNCALAATDRRATVGFVSAGKSRPMSLLRGDKLEAGKSHAVELILRRNAGTRLFHDILFGDLSALEKYYEKIKEFLAPNLRPGRPEAVFLG